MVLHSGEAKPNASPTPAGRERVVVTTSGGTPSATPRDPSAVISDRSNSATAEGSSNAPSPRENEPIEVLVKLVRQKLKSGSGLFPSRSPGPVAEPVRPSGSPIDVGPGKCGTPVAAGQKMTYPAKTVVPSSFQSLVPSLHSHCWLCGRLAESHFQFVDSHPLCLECFQLCFMAVIRPLLFDDKHGAEVAARLAAAQLADELSPPKKATTPPRGAAPVKSPRPSSQPQSWCCPRCTFANTADVEWCTVCGAESPNTVKCNHCGMSCRGANASPSRPRVRRGSVPTFAPNASPLTEFYNNAANAIGLPRTGGVPPVVRALPVVPGLGPTIGGHISPLGYPQALPQQPNYNQAALVPAKTLCPSSQRLHEVWECESCTYRNTIEVDHCTVCQQSRIWVCRTCRCNNRSRAAGAGKFCTTCGADNSPPELPSGAASPKHSMNASTGELSASYLRRLGLDPAEMERERLRNSELERNTARLNQRIASLGLSREVQLGDGNCQFRALSNQLFGNPKHHMLMRHLVVLHMRSRQPLYSMLFESPDAFEAYLVSMSESGTWGDEITLRAASDAFGVHLHVITADEVRWHLHFSPTTSDVRAAPQGGSARDEQKQSPGASNPGSTTEPSAYVLAERNGDSTTAVLSTPHQTDPMDDELPHLLLLYLAPVHYDDVVRPPRLPLIGETLKAILEKLQVEEASWDSVDEHSRATGNFVDWVEVAPRGDGDMPVGRAPTQARALGAAVATESVAAAAVARAATASGSPKQVSVASPTATTGVASASTSSGGKVTVVAPGPKPRTGSTPSSPDVCDDSVMVPDQESKQLLRIRLSSRRLTADRRKPSSVVFV